MKYERLTQWVGDGASLILDNPTTAEEARQQVMVQFKKACIKLAELEDKIERGELILTVQNEQSKQEIAFFAKHYAVARKEAAKEFAEKLKSHVILKYTMDGEFVEDINIWCLFKDIDDLVKEACG